MQCLEEYREPPNWSQEINPNPSNWSLMGSFVNPNYESAKLVGDQIAARGPGLGNRRIGWRHGSCIRRDKEAWWTRRGIIPTRRDILCQSLLRHQCSNRIGFTQKLRHRLLSRFSYRSWRRSWTTGRGLRGVPEREVYRCFDRFSGTADKIAGTTWTIGIVKVMSAATPEK